MDASPWVLIFGAAIGGVLCFVLQALFGLVEVTGSLGAMFKTLFVGLGSATLLSGVVTVLISRLAKADFVLVVRVNDIWGAMTAGFVIQWFGYKILLHLIPPLVQTTQ